MWAPAVQIASNRAVCAVGLALAVCCSLEASVVASAG